MGTGWRRAFCTTIPRNSSDDPNPTAKSSQFFKHNNNSNPSTPRLHTLRSNSINGAQINDDDDDSKFQSSVIDNLNITPRLRCRVNAKTTKSLVSNSSPSSPRSPFSIFKHTLGLYRNNCGVCMQSVKTGHKTAIFTAECSHTFHFPCISAHLKTQNNLICPICKAVWTNISFLNIQNHNPIKPPNQAPVKLKPYDDDEPLHTPRAAPIPESAAENEDDDEEFKGFFVNPVSSDKFGRDFKAVEVVLSPEVAVVSASESYETYALVLKVKAPPPPPPAEVPRRAPIDLVAVLDVSVTMGGAKLQMLKRAMRLVISSLGSADRLAIVAFSAYPKRVLPLKRMCPRGQRSARRIIDQLSLSRGSCAGEALRTATKVLEDRRERNPVASIILLSDGQDDRMEDNNQNQRQPSNHVSSTRFAHVEIPVHTFGEKTGAENEFTKCVGGLLSVVTQDLRVQLGISSGSDPAEITAVYSSNGRPAVLNSGSIRFGDLYAEEEKEVLVELRVPRSKSNAGAHHVLSARCSFNDPATQELINGVDKALLVPRAQSVRLSNSPQIERLRNLFIATRAVAESRLLVQYNKPTTAQQLLASARGLLMQSASAEEFVRGLEAELVDVQWRVQHQKQNVQVDENGEPLTPRSAWKAAEKLARVAVTKKSLIRVNDLHGLENARF